VLNHQKIGPFDHNSNLTQPQKNAVEAVRLAYKQLHETLNTYVAPGRELSVAVTNLEQSAMWAIKGITHS
jgi:hypothetical protein